MTRTHFTRATWRHGKRQRRKLKRPWGGQIQAPQAFLDAARQTYFRKGMQGSRRCKACGRLALKGKTVCGAHGGFSALASEGKLIQKSRTWQRPNQTPQAPLELARLAIYQSADKTSRARLAMAWQTPAWIQAAKAVRAEQERV